MSDLTIGLLGALLATNQPQAVSNLVQQHTGVAVRMVNRDDPAEKELRQWMIADDDALDEVNAWMSTNNIARTNAPAIAELNQRIRARFEVVKMGYDGFLRNHPDSARGFLAYGSFLHDIGDELGAKGQYEKSRQLDPGNPAVWNQLANYYGEFGELTNAFVGYTEAIRLDPTEPVYYQNFGTTVYLYRKDAREFYGINEQQVFDKALGLYREAMKLAPSNLVFATDYAESYYGIRPLRTNDALVAWTNALNLTKDENEREGVQLHLARVKTSAGFFDEAQGHLDTVTNAVFGDLKKRLIRSLADHRNPPVEAAEVISTNRIATATNLDVEATNTPAGNTNRASAVPTVEPVPTNALPVSTNAPSLGK